MTNIIILGSGRSGTSMLAGMFAGCGFFMGDRLWPANESNPTGFFEDEEVNRINEDILSTMLPRRWPGPLAMLTRDRLGDMQRWLSEVPVGARVPEDPGIARRISRIVARAPFCLKDPRFSYTLPAWRPWLRDTRFLVVFRDPATTVSSILKECRVAPYLHDLRMDSGRAFRGWTTMYRHILELHRHAGEWGWFHYDQLQTPDGMDRLESFCGVRVDRGFARDDLRRSRPTDSTSAPAMAVYGQLLQLAGWHPR
jgi:hypothetical protein